MYGRPKHRVARQAHLPEDSVVAGSIKMCSRDGEFEASAFRLSRKHIRKGVPKVTYSTHCQLSQWLDSRLRVTHSNLDFDGGDSAIDIGPMPYNKHLDQFLMFYSQSDAGNGLTRGLDSDLAKRTYVATKLDRTLTDTMLRKQYRVVILTGNAGDGKTAFIQKVEEAARARGASVTRDDTLGSRFTLDGRLFRTLYDGSVETSHASNLEMLRAFFHDVAGNAAPTSDVSLIVATE